MATQQSQVTVESKWGTTAAEQQQGPASSADEPSGSSKPELGSTAAERQQDAASDGDSEMPSGRVTDYCLWGSQLPISLQEAARPLEVDGSSFPAPINTEE